MATTFWTTMLMAAKKKKKMHLEIIWTIVLMLRHPDDDNKDDFSQRVDLGSFLGIPLLIQMWTMIEIFLMMMGVTPLTN